MKHYLVVKRDEELTCIKAWVEYGKHYAEEKKLDRGLHSE